MRKLTLASLIFFSCGGVTGSGHSVITSRDIGPFHRVAVADGIQLIGVPADRALTVQADDNLIDLVETVVTAETLNVRLKPDLWISSATTIIVTVANDAFDAVSASGGSKVRLAMTPCDAVPIAASGGSDIELTDVAATTLDAEATGGSKITLTGTATDASVRASGGSTLNLRSVPLETLSLHLSGASTLDARVASSLTGSLSGGSTVNIVGTPTNQVQSSGGSQLSTGNR